MTNKVYTRGVCCASCGKRWSTAAEASLCYIADSPPAEHGGFHLSTISVAKQALAIIARLRKRAKQAAK